MLLPAKRMVTLSCKTANKPGIGKPFTELSTCISLEGLDRFGIFGANADTDIKEEENSHIRLIDRYSVYNILKMVLKYM